MIDIASFGWPQWLYLALVVLSILMVAAKHAQPITVNAPAQIAVKLVILVILALGGFFHG